MRRKPRWLVLLPMVACIVAACGDEPTTGAATPSRQTTVTSPTGTPIVQESLETGVQAREEAERYLRSSDRIARFQAVWPAAEKIATAILKGRFGPVLTLDTAKQPVAPGYEGKCLISTDSPPAFAGVWCRADGTVDLARGVDQFGVNGLLLFIAEYSMAGLYEVMVPRQGAYETAQNSPVFIGEQRPTGPYFYPVSLEELRAIDDEALALLPVYLAAVGVTG
jgi:hypothetical protein